MAKFNDLQGREHVVEITIHTLRELKKSELAFDLTRLLVAGSDELKRVQDDPILLTDLVYFVSQLNRPEAERIGGESFYKALAGDALGKAHASLMEALADFSPSPEERAFLRELKTKSEGVTEAKFAQARKRLETIDLEKISDSPPTMCGSPTNPSPPSDSLSNSAESSDSLRQNSIP